MENQYPTSSATCPTRGSHHHMPWHLPGSPTCVRLVSRARAGNTWPSRPPPPLSIQAVRSSDLLFVALFSIPTPFCFCLPQTHNLPTTPCSIPLFIAPTFFSSPFCNFSSHSSPPPCPTSLISLQYPLLSFSSSLPHYHLCPCPVTLLSLSYAETPYHLCSPCLPSIAYPFIFLLWSICPRTLYPLFPLISNLI